MKMTNNTNDCILATDFNEVDRDMKVWQKKRESKGNIYKAFSEYIECLENSLECETDSYKRYLIEHEIKQLKREQKRYYVPSVLEITKYDSKTSIDSKKKLGKSSFPLVKKFKKN